ncbi:MAG: hypothetical protein IIB55_08760 [Planctomycetes bacterium]|nr:hypothetical protein [Planctomycetota bacterium]
MSIAIKILVVSVVGSLWALAPEIAATPASDPEQRVTPDEISKAKELLERAAREQLIHADDAAMSAAIVLERAARQQQLVEAMALAVRHQGAEQQVRQEALRRAYTEALARFGVARDTQVLEIEQELDRHRDRYHEVRDQALHMREIIAKLEARRPDEGGDDVEQLRAHEQQLREVHLELQRLEIEAERSEMGLQRLEEVRERRMERSNIESMMDRIDYVANWKDIAFESDLAVSMAVQGIVEMQFTAGESGEAIEILSDLLERVEQVGARTALRFAIKDVAASKGET